MYIYMYNYVDVGDGSGSHLEALLKSYNTLNRAVESFNIHSIHLTGE